MQTTSHTEITASYMMTSDNIASYVQYEVDRGASEESIRVAKRVTKALFEWLPEDKVITKERLLTWRQDLKEHGYTYQTEQNYVKGINRYLDFMGFSDVRFNRGKPKDLRNREFGFLKAIEPTGAKHRKDIIWRCQCRCGKEVECPATSLLLGNTVSCGCLRGAHFKKANKYIAGTSLRQSIEEQVCSTRSMSGYTGVTVKRGKWKAYIKYKGKDISLGCYDKLEDAVKARAGGKELVQMDAMGLLDFYEELHKEDPALPDRDRVRAENKTPKQILPPPQILPAIRSDNTSGHPGVHRKRNKWSAKITWQKVTYHLGSYKSIEEAIAVRQAAEKRLQEDPHGFPDWVLNRQVGKQE